MSSLPPAIHEQFVRMARRALWAADHQLVHLVQRRNGPGDYSYLAIARPRRKGSAPDFATLLITEQAE